MAKRKRGRPSKWSALLADPNWALGAVSFMVIAMLTYSTFLAAETRALSQSLRDESLSERRAIEANVIDLTRSGSYQKGYLEGYLDGLGKRPAYSPELYEDCQDALGAFDPEDLRRTWVADSPQAEMADNEILKVGCLLFATGDMPWRDLLR